MEDPSSCCLMGCSWWFLRTWCGENISTHNSPLACVFMETIVGWPFLVLLQGSIHCHDREWIEVWDQVRGVFWRWRFLTRGIRRTRIAMVQIIGWREASTVAFRQQHKKGDVGYERKEQVVAPMCSNGRVRLVLLLIRKCKRASVWAIGVIKFCLY